MKIVEAKVIVCCPGRNFVTLKITTEDGVYGLGDATLNGRELAVASYLNDHVIPLLLGRDARRIEDTWQYLYKGAYWRRGPVTMSAIAAVDTALWDIKAKGMPAAPESKRPSRLWRITSRMDTRRFARNPAFRDCRAHTESGEESCTTNRLKRMLRRRIAGRQKRT
jgi:hypothetical protein